MEGESGDDRLTLQAPSLVDALHQELREEIFSGKISGGEPITEILLATRFSVARPTAKAAMERLVHEGLLTRQTNKTARVPLLSIADVQDLYYSRGFLERELVMALCERRVVPGAARKAVQALREFEGAPDLTDVVSADVAFHLALLDSLESPRLRRLYETLMGEVRLCMAQVQAHQLLEPARIADEHVAIIAAIEAGDTSLAISEINDHLDHACTRLIQYLEGSEIG